MKKPSTASPNSRARSSESASAGSVQKVFIVHGRDTMLRRVVADFVAKLGKEPIVLADESSGGRTVIEKFEHYASGASYAIVLMTPDDIGQLKGSESTQRARARQNVLFELGYFMAKLGRGKVCLLSTPDVELPSDLHGIVSISLESIDEWPWALVREFLDAGVEFAPKAMAHACKGVFEWREAMNARKLHGA